MHKPKNYQRFLRYLTNISFGLRDEERPEILEKDSIFIPFGWDTFGKASSVNDSFDFKFVSEADEKELEYSYANVIPNIWSPTVRSN
jgi:hypothetical protein